MDGKENRLPRSRPPEDLPPVVVERRPSPRKRVLWPGKVIWGKNLFSIDCIIRDLTESGAKISIAKGQVLPTHVELTDLKNGIVRNAEVVWIKLPIYGLKFTGSARPYKASHPVPVPEDF